MVIDHLPLRHFSLECLQLIARERRNASPARNTGFSG
jgi:hypothetical protein